MFWERNSLLVVLVLLLLVLAFEVHSALYPNYVQIAEQQVDALFYPKTDKIKPTANQVQVKQALAAIAEIPQDNNKDKELKGLLALQAIDALNQVSEREHNGTEGVK